MKHDIKTCPDPVADNFLKWYFTCTIPSPDRKYRLHTAYMDYSVNDLNARLYDENTFEQILTDFGFHCETIDSEKYLCGLWPLMFSTPKERKIARESC